MKDQLSIDQTIESMNNINDKIYEVQRAPGNRRTIDIKISKGRLIFDAASNSILWRIEKSKFKYSEPGLEINVGNLMVKTIESNPYTVDLWKNYSIDITNNGKQEFKELDEASTPYQLSIENMGISPEGKIIIDIGNKSKGIDYMGFGGDD